MLSRYSESEVYTLGHLDSSSAAFAPPNFVRSRIGSADKISDAKRTALRVGPLRHKRVTCGRREFFGPSLAFFHLWGAVAQ